jgi:PAS domain S-box-containing protein
MDSYRGELLRIKEILNTHPRGMSLSEISRRLHVTRNAVAKYLDVLLATGQVEMRRIGSAKQYFISERVPLSALLYLCSDPMVVFDECRSVVFANDPFLNLAAALPDLFDRAVLDIPFMNTPFLIAALEHPARKPLTLSNLIRVEGPEEAYFQVKLIPTVLEDGRPATAALFEDVTDRVHLHLDLGLERGRLRAIIDSAQEAIVVTDTEGRIQLMNLAAERLYCTSGFCHSCGVECDPRDDPLVRSAQCGETVRGAHLTIFCQDGEKRELLANTAPIIGSSGQRIGAVGVFSDITRWTYLSDAFEDDLGCYRVLVEHARHMIAIHDGEKYLFINAAGVRLLGAQDPGEVIGKPIRAILHPDSFNILEIRRKQFQGRTGSIPSAEVKVLRRDGTTVTLESFGHAIEHRGRTLMLIVARDVAGPKQIEARGGADDGCLSSALLPIPYGTGHLCTIEGAVLELAGLADDGCSAGRMG